MPNKLKQILNKYWLFFIIATQPLLDIIAYFSFNEKVTLVSFIIRSIYLVFIVMYTFLKIKDKKKMLLLLLPIFIFSMLHILNTYRLFGLQIFDDVRYLILVMQLPIITICLSKYLKEYPEYLESINNGFLTSLTIIFISVVISVVTNSGNLTYSTYGLTGWFTSANTQSMILSVISPYCLYLFYKKSNTAYLIGILMIFALLFFNGTKACYYSLIISFFTVFYIILISKKGIKNLFKLFITIIVFVFSIILYRYSTAAIRATDVSNNNKKNLELFESLPENPTDEDYIALLREFYQFRDIMDSFGDERVYNAVKDEISLNTLSDIRFIKRLYGKFIFEDSDLITKFVGFNHAEISKHESDLENDITAIYYYYGYIGISLYIFFLAYFVYIGIKALIKNPANIVNGRFIILSCTIALSVFGSELSGALLRKSNANIYFAIILSIYYLFVSSSIDEKPKKSNKLTFLLLHLGYGGIETATINTANALSDKYEIEIISFYNLKQNQANKLNKNITIKYLCRYEPNREKIYYLLKHHKYLSLIKEGFIAAKILVQKKFFIIDEIVNSDSKFIVSTRYDFSKLLSKYGNKDSIKIAQEHHYHNNDKKYINILKNKYNNIDYLFALTKGLQADYKKFLVKNNHTKVVLVPNMILEKDKESSRLDTKNLITVSRLDKKKRIDEIINIFSKISDTKSKLFIIGDGAELANLKSQTKSLNLENRIIFTGYKDKNDIKNYLLNSSIFLMASETEGLPMVLLEAMSLGVPCIAYETASGTADIISNEKNGFIIYNRDQEEYINKVEYLLSNKKIRNRMGVKAKETAKMFSKENICKIWYKILK